MLFSAEISDFRMVYNVLRAITFRDYAIVRPMEEGLKFTLEEMQSIETSAYVPQTMFTTYKIDGSEDIIFKISMKVFTECLNIFGDESNSSIKLSYRALGSPLCLVITHNEENITVDCEIKTLNIDDYPDVSLAEECNLNKIVIEANIFTELLQRLDNSADEIKITISPDIPYFSLTTTGIGGESQVNVSKHSDSVSVYHCKEKTEALYAFANIRQVLRVMHFAQKIAISTGESGLLGLQLVIMADEKQMYVEYYVTAQYSD